MSFDQLWLSIEIDKIKKRIAGLILIFTTTFTNIAEAQWTKNELQAIAQTLAGECYDDKELDKRRVCEVILNRVSSKKFANSIIEVLRTPTAFNGYWKQSRPISKNDYEVAEQTLKDWYENGCKPLSDWLYFRRGSNRENVFRSKF